MSPRDFLPRHLLAGVRESLQDTRVVAVVGPRQAGKSTLVQQVVAELPSTGTSDPAGS